MSSCICPLSAVEVVVEVLQVGLAFEVDEGVAIVGGGFGFIREIQIIVFAFELLVDFEEQQVLIVVAGDIANHQRGSLIALNLGWIFKSIRLTAKC